MKRLFLFLGLGLFLSFVCSFLSISASAMRVETSVTLSDKADTPFVIDSTSAITLTFSEPLNPDTVTDGVKLYRVISTGDLTEVPCKTTFNNSTPSLLNITKQDGTKLAEGEEYKIVISSTIKSANKTDLGKEIIGYFATNYSFNLGPEGIPELNGTRSLIISISDIHAGDIRTITGGYNLFEKNKTALVNFLKQIRIAPNVRELVIDGDLFDEWFGPMDNEPFNGMTESGFLDSIAAANQTMTNAINNIIKDGQIKVTYIPGNHDMLVTSADIQRTLPGISEAKDAAQGLGSYTPMDHSEIIIEHGNRYEFFNAPDPVSNRSITKTDSILPPGFFFSRIRHSSIPGNPSTTIVLPAIAVNTEDESQYLCSVYWKVWNFIITHTPLSTGLNDKIIKTGIDGYKDTYAISDLIPYNSNGNGSLDVSLFKGIQDTWEERQTKNLVPVKIGARPAITAFESSMATRDFSAFDEMAITQYFHNGASNKRIVLFGHSHEACIKPSFNLKNQKTIYANSGTWQDMGDPLFPPMTFVVITPQKTSDSTPEYVTLYQYSQSGTITKMKNQSALTNLIPNAGVKDGASYK